VIAKTFLRQEDRNDDHFQHQTNQAEMNKEPRQDEADDDRGCKQCKNGQDTIQPPPAGGESRAIERLLEQIDRLTEDHDGMRQAAPQPGRVTDDPIKPDGSQQQEKMAHAITSGKT